MSAIDKLAQRIAADIRAERSEDPGPLRHCVNCRYSSTAEWPFSKRARKVCSHPELVSRVDGSAASCAEQRESRSAQACGGEGRLFVERVGDSAEFGCQPLQAESNQKI